MAKLSRAVWREASLFGQHFAEVRKQWQILTGGGAVIVTLWVLSLPQIAPLVAPLIAKWHLVAMTAGLTLLLAQYRAWRKQRLQLDGDPYFYGGIGYGPDAENELERGFRAEFKVLRTKNEPQELLVYTSGGINSCECQITKPWQGEHEVGTRLKKDCIVFPLSLCPLPEGTLISFGAWSHSSPLHSKRVYLVKRGSSGEY